MKRLPIFRFKKKHKFQYVSRRSVPISHDFARSILPRHWTPKFDADVYADIRYSLRWMFW